jgi:hypothetical protein
MSILDTLQAAALGKAINEVKGSPGAVVDKLQPLINRVALGGNPASIVGGLAGTLGGQLGGSLGANLGEQIGKVIGGNSRDSFVPKGKAGARDPLSAGRARLDPLLSFNWYCDLPPINGAELSWEFIEEATLPFVEIEQISNYRAGKMYHFAHHYSIGTLSLKLYEDSQGIASTFLDKWRRQILDIDSGLYYHSREYKQTIKFTILDVAKQTVMFIEYTGCWPMRSDAFQMTSGSSERIAPTVEFSVDEMRIKFGKFDSNNVPAIIDSVGMDFPPQLSGMSLINRATDSYIQQAQNDIKSQLQTVFSPLMLLTLDAS